MKRENLRKSLSLLACLSLMCALLLACSGCGGGDKKALIGDWEATIDLTDMTNDEMAAGLRNDPDMLKYFKVEKFTMNLTLSFKDDDTYSMTVDEDALDKEIDAIIESFKAGTTQYFEDMIAAEGLDVSVEDALAAMGYTLDGFLDEAFPKENFTSSVNEMESKGTFEAKGGVLYLTDDDGTGLESYKLEDNKLTLTGEGVDDSDLEGLYPLVFTKK